MNKTEKLMNLRKIIQANRTERLIIECDDCKQHSRRRCLGIYKIESSDEI